MVLHFGVNFGEKYVIERFVIKREFYMNGIGDLVGTSLIGSLYGRVRYRQISLHFHAIRMRLFSILRLCNFRATCRMKNIQIPCT